MWREARAQFFKMATTSGQVRRAKGAYERMKGEAIELQLECGEYAARARAAGGDFFTARRRVLEANRQQEKLGILRDEIRLLAQQSEM
ncbi:hypothetical protein [Rugamonas violacea]|uniref:hypothetical protein n=1 Tax=Rugamonas sp. CCM 8940 TaxID=2765359 RepID=UPI001F2DEA98|nr:hypothetical protein [Rugamonas sp. CCM 8940]